MRNVFMTLWFTLNGWVGGVLVALALTMPSNSLAAPPWWAWLLASAAPAFLILHGLRREYSRSELQRRA